MEKDSSGTCETAFGFQQLQEDSGGRRVKL